MLIHLIMFSILMPSWNVWSGKALSSKFDFRDDPSAITKVTFMCESISIIYEIEGGGGGGWI